MSDLPPLEQWLVFTDLDGTLLDHDTYSFSAAQPALTRLRDAGVPVVLNSSKTVTELRSLASDLELASPIIAENGSIIAYPDQRRIVLGAAYGDICSTLDELRKNQGYRFHGFHDWSAREIAWETGLSLNDAEAAGAREGTEPLRWEDSDVALQDFTWQVSEAGLVLTRGGRFLHVMGQTSKAEAMRYLMDERGAIINSAPFVIALGDGPNDAEMLAVADIAVIIANPSGTPLKLPESPDQTLIRSDLPGPEGWNEIMNGLIDRANAQ